MTLKSSYQIFGFLWPYTLKSSYQIFGFLWPYTLAFGKTHRNWHLRVKSSAMRFGHSVLSSHTSSLHLVMKNFFCSPFLPIHSITSLYLFFPSPSRLYGGRKLGCIASFMFTLAYVLFFSFLSGDIIWRRTQCQFSTLDPVNTQGPVIWCWAKCALDVSFGQHNSTLIIRGRRKT